LNFCVLAIPAGFLMRDWLASGKRDFARFLRQSIGLAAGVFVLLLPWGIRNRIVLGEWLFTRSMLGYGLALSYHDGAHWGEPVNNHPGRLIPGHAADTSLSPYPFLNERLRPTVARLGELEWDRRKRREGLTWIAAHPWRSLILLGQHAFYFWFPPGADFYSESPRALMRLYASAKWLLTLLALAGWLRLRRLTPSAAQSLAVVLVSFPLIYYVVNWSSRYRMPIEWVLVLLAGVTIGGIYDLWHAPSRPTSATA
jgi:hypothetical protein